MSNTKEIIDELQNLLEDSALPKNVKTKILATITILEEDSDISLKRDKALQLLDNLGEDTNLQSFTRTQLWNIISMLEKR